MAKRPRKRGGFIPKKNKSVLKGGKPLKGQAPRPGSTYDKTRKRIMKKNKM